MADLATDVPASDHAFRQRKGVKLRWALIVGLVLAVLIAGAWYHRHETYGKYQQSTNDAFVQSDAVVVSSRLNGIVERVFVAENQRVRRGDPLIQIDAREFDAQVRQAAAQVGLADANVESIRAQIREQSSTIDQADAQLMSASGRLDYANQQVVRFAPLVASGAERGDKLAELRHERQQAAAELAASRARLAASRRRVQTLQSQIHQITSERRAAEAQLGSANINLGAAIVRASIDGVVGNKTVQVGQYVQPGLRMMSIVPVQSVYVEANFKETQLGLMRVGQPVIVRVDALGNVDIPGFVQSFSPGTGAQFSLLPPQNATGNFTKIVQRVSVHVEIIAGVEAKRLMVPGMSASVTVDTRSARNAHEVVEREQRLKAQQR